MQDRYLDRQIHVGQILRQIDTYRIYTQTDRTCRIDTYTDRYMQDRYLDRQKHVGYILRQIDPSRVNIQTDRYMQDRYLDRQIHVGYILRQREHVEQIFRQIYTCRINK